MRTNHGFSKIELLVASSLLSALVLIAVPLITRLQNVWKSTRMYQIATLELANRMDALRELEPAACEAAIGSLQVSEPMKASLLNAELTGELIRIEEETRIVLRMKLDPTVRQEPLVLIGWLLSDKEPSL
jgi:competence protein ComGC